MFVYHMRKLAETSSAASDVRRCTCILSPPIPPSTEFALFLLPVMLLIKASRQLAQTTTAHAGAWPGWPMRL
jgi:hypothetical protein